tara:strand:- start:1529 stop:2239 length:711 start_codon:yes stop_codon:yes gene_type:complete
VPINNTFEYNLDYFSGAQAAMFIENILIDEVTSLQWTVQQSKVPIYGYASQVFDEMAKGTIIVQGSFSINFIETGYLWSVLDYVNNRPLTEEGAAMLRRRDLTDLTKSSVDNWIQQNLGDSKQGTQGLFDTYKKLKEQQETGSGNFKTLTEAINDYVWGPPFRDGKGLDEDFAGMRRTDRRELNGFDIYVRFNHSGTSGETIYKIEDVHLLGKAQTVVIDENPVQEVYSFYAKNVL